MGLYVVFFEVPLATMRPSIRGSIPTAKTKLCFEGVKKLICYDNNDLS